MSPTEARCAHEKHQSKWDINISLPSPCSWSWWRMIMPLFSPLCLSFQITHAIFYFESWLNSGSKNCYERYLINQSLQSFLCRIANVSFIMFFIQFDFFDAVFVGKPERGTCDTKSMYRYEFKSSINRKDQQPIKYSANQQSTLLFFHISGNLSVLFQCSTESVLIAPLIATSIPLLLILGTSKSWSTHLILDVSISCCLSPIIMNFHVQNAINRALLFVSF